MLSSNSLRKENNLIYERLSFIKTLPVPIQFQFNFPLKNQERKVLDFIVP